MSSRMNNWIIETRAAISHRLKAISASYSGLTSWSDGVRISTGNFLADDPLDARSRTLESEIVLEAMRDFEIQTVQLKLSNKNRLNNTKGVYTVKKNTKSEKRWKTINNFRFHTKNIF